MALEHFKTQVLLLHSQQSTLDALSAGFGDRYAVHLATSGTEALNTLGETPIHVIVSAQDLPGMSGLEALREAKKRSPDTIGILLAGSDPQDGLEALVGDKEVFQIVRGAITPDALQNLIDTATKRVRMLTISESANDLAANVDEPVAEHIVMETSENGSSIVSDGTGRLPVLKPHHVHIAPHAGGRDIDVLVLSKDEDFVATIRDSSYESHTVHQANTPVQAEAIVRAHKVGVLVTDAAMVGSNIEVITERLRKDAPRLVAVVAGRRDDGELLMDLIHRGQVYRFLLKPVSPGRARLAIEASVKHHLEAADSAFKGKPRADAVAPKDERKPPRAAKVARIAPKISATPRPGAADKAGQAAIPPSPVDSSRKSTDSLNIGLQDDLDAAFGDSGRFARTMTGIAATVGKSFGGTADPADATKASGDRSPGADGPPAIFRPKRLAIGGGTIAIVAALAWWLFPDFAEPDRAREAEKDAPSTVVASPSVVESDVPDSGRQPASQTDVAAPAYQKFLDEARIARDAGEIVVPPGSNAIELYVAAREIAPDEVAIVSELGQVVTTAIGLAESALLDQRTADAAQTLRVVRLADPANPRLPFLEAQLTQLQLRVSLDQARVAVRERRFEDAATALGNATTAAGAETPEIGLLVEELATARSEQRIDEVLALANQRLEQNALTSPSNDNARYYYELALSNDPENTVAQQGLTIVASKLVLRAREAIDVLQLDQAERFLRDATTLDPQSADLGASMQALNSAKAARDAAALAEAEADRQAELEDEAALAQAGNQTGRTDFAGRAGGGQPAPAGETGMDSAGSGDPAEMQGAQDGLTAQRTSGTGFAGTPGDTAPDEDRAANVTAGSGDGSAQEAGSSADSGAGSSGYVAISTLKRTNYVAPNYPRSAQRRNITGWVDVTFTVNRGGNVANVGVLDSSPGDVFNDAATEAVSQWRFEPSVENGVPVEKLVAVRLMFSLE